MVSNRHELSLWRWWFLFGIGLVLLVVYLSLANISLPEAASGFGDKVNHLIAYAALMGWFGQLFTSWRDRIFLACGLMLLGVAMEYGQAMTAYRYFDWLDAVANSLGVLLGVISLMLGADKILLWFEKRVLLALSGS